MHSLGVDDSFDDSLNTHFIRIGGCTFSDVFLSDISVLRCVRNPAYCPTRAHPAPHKKHEEEKEHTAYPHMSRSSSTNAFFKNNVGTMDGKEVMDSSSSSPFVFEWVKVQMEGRGSPMAPRGDHTAAVLPCVTPSNRTDMTYDYSQDSRHVHRIIVFGGIDAGYFVPGSSVVRYDTSRMAASWERVTFSGASLHHNRYAAQMVCTYAGVHALAAALCSVLVLVYTLHRILTANDDDILIDNNTWGQRVIIGRYRVSTGKDCIAADIHLFTFVNARCLLVGFYGPLLMLSYSMLSLYHHYGVL